jgi:hypothetical protein
MLCFIQFLAGSVKTPFAELENSSFGYLADVDARLHPWWCIGDFEQGVNLGFQVVVQPFPYTILKWATINNPRPGDASHGHWATTLFAQGSLVHYTQHGPVTKGSFLEFDYKVDNTAKAYNYGPSMDITDNKYYDVVNPCRQVRYKLVTSCSSFNTPGHYSCCLTHAKTAQLCGKITDTMADKCLDCNQATIILFTIYVMFPTTLGCRKEH